MCDPFKLRNEHLKKIILMVCLNIKYQGFDMCRQQTVILLKYLQVLVIVWNNTLNWQKFSKVQMWVFFVYHCDSLMYFDILHWSCAVYVLCMVTFTWTTTVKTTQFVDRYLCLKSGLDYFDIFICTLIHHG